MVDRTLERRDDEGRTALAVLGSGGAALARHLSRRRRWDPLGHDRPCRTQRRCRRRPGGHGPVGGPHPAAGAADGRRGSATPLVPSSHHRQENRVTTTHFGARLAEAMGRHGPLCVGLDPHPRLLADWGLPDDADGLRVFSGRVLDAAAGRCAAVKPQSAFFERHGAEGVRVLEEVLAGCRERGLLSVLDVKRGDIGSTMLAYAEAYLADGAPLAADSVTLSPYLGYGALRPAVDLARATGRGVWVLGLTSNPEGAQVQQVGSPSVAARVVDQVAADNAGLAPFGDVGLVVGATLPATPSVLGLDLSAAGAPVLAPGVGAQGASGADVARVFAGLTDRVLVPVGRGILAAGPRPDDLVRAVTTWSGQLRRDLAPG
ncbi:orotidine-5'-phosphate decarboxylase [Ornithinimicrobium kibberense]|uniref:orotidine-5'-phosphate decarboxylase n=1 Tax=Ornithinimicrobium kibberense TaxID=282060 RepID=UPI003614018F